MRRAQLLGEALSKCHPLTDTELVFDSNNGHLVHLTGTMTTDEVIGIKSLSLMRCSSMCV